MELFLQDLYIEGKWESKGDGMQAEELRGKVHVLDQERGSNVEGR